MRSPFPLCGAFGSGKPKAARARVADWVADNTLLAGLRVGLRETYDYLLNRRPSYAEFERWLIEKNGGAIEAAVWNVSIMRSHRRGFRVGRTT